MESVEELCADSSWVGQDRVVALAAAHLDVRPDVVASEISRMVDTDLLERCRTCSTAVGLTENGHQLLHGDPERPGPPAEETFGWLLARRDRS